MKSMNWFKEWSSIIATWTTITGALIGGAITLWQIHDNAKTERVKVTLEYVDRYNKDPIYTVRLSLEDFWNKRKEAIFTRASSSEIELSEYTVKSIQSNDIELKSSILFDFFDNLHACICGNLCDEDTSKRLFGKHTYDFYGLYYPYIKYQRKALKDETYGLGMESIANSYIIRKLHISDSCNSSN